LLLLCGLLFAKDENLIVFLESELALVANMSEGEVVVAAALADPVANSVLSFLGL